MKAIIIKCAPKPGRDPLEVPGWLVPDTEDLFGVDMRYECDLEAIPPHPNGWVITHLPTGSRLSYHDYTGAGTREDAIGIAQRFYSEYMARGWNLHSEVSAEITEPVQQLNHAERTQFWERVAGGWWCKGCEKLHRTECPASTSREPQL
jgi:hypothetical protein